MDAFEPFGAALAAFAAGDTGAQLTIRRDDGLAQRVPVGHFFRRPSEFSTIERFALARCEGPALDAGAGSGMHALALQSQGLRVTAIDICERAVGVMASRGVEDVRCADVLEFSGGPFRTILMLGHGVGMLGTVAGLHRFLRHAHALLPNGGTGGEILFDSLDVRASDDPRHAAYWERCRGKGRQVGETRVCLEFRGERGTECDWLHVDPVSMRSHAHAAGWEFELLLGECDGNYLGALRRA